MAEIFHFKVSNFREKSHNDYSQTDIFTIYYRIDVIFLMQNHSFKTFPNRCHTLWSDKVKIQSLHNFSCHFLIVHGTNAPDISTKVQEIIRTTTFPLPLLCSYKNERNRKPNPFSPLQFSFHFQCLREGVVKMFFCRYLWIRRSYRSAVWGIWKATSSAKFFQLQVH